VNEELNGSLLFYNYLAIRYKDETAYAKVKSTLISLKPQYLAEGSQLFDNHMHAYAYKLDTFIDKELEQIDFDNILFFGISANLYQWICSSIIAKKVKEKGVDTPIVIGGIGTRESAISFLRAFKQFDIAQWGEGEASSLKIAECLEGLTSNGASLSTIPHIAYRNNDSVEVSNVVNHTFIDLSSKEIVPNFDDYFQQSASDENPHEHTLLFVEGSRSCHWRRCHFCYLNTGYKYRLKSIQAIDEEIREAIKKHEVYKFSFLDNDLIGNDWERFSSLLDVLIAIKQDYSEFQIELAEIITKNISSSYIRKMSMAGFRHVQIGYESASNSLLNRIDKKNTFASNLLFIKFASKYNILIGGVNVIRGLLEETYEDILEAIENLRYLRFFFRGGLFKHNMSNLGIMHSSRYYNAAKENIHLFNLSVMLDFLPEGYVAQEEVDKCTIIERLCYNTKKTWNEFSVVEAHYLRSHYTYQVYAMESSLLYKEWLNNEIINELEIEYSSLEYLILKNSCEKVLDIKELMRLISETDYRGILDCELYDIIENLRNEGLVYTPKDYSEILSVIDLANTL
jgi:radical SAM superfamily enzyme YgiQ (UPF0313 family)